MCIRSLGKPEWGSLNFKCGISTVAIDCHSCRLEEVVQLSLIKPDTKACLEEPWGSLLLASDITKQ